MFLPLECLFSTIVEHCATTQTTTGMEHRTWKSRRKIFLSFIHLLLLVFFFLLLFGSFLVLLTTMSMTIILVRFLSFVRWCGSRESLPLHAFGECIDFTHEPFPPTLVTVDADNEWQQAFSSFPSSLWSFAGHFYFALTTYTNCRSVDRSEWSSQHPLNIHINSLSRVLFII